ncbi:lipopolysaccharide biosynthesis protein [Vibrio rumoiensis]|uniref:lipopolysaccharide biosynthesis protein n=1 Tax=Vibrio rumoiensis TaxID=76258 RepID=UPI00374974E7
MIKNIIKWQTLSSVVVFSLTLLQVAVLARLLNLSDFGLVAIVMVVINISQVLSDLGMANYLVYRQKVSDSLNSTVFWICFSSGIMLFFLLTLLSPLIANLYGESEISTLLPLSALAFIPISLSSQMQARYICEFKLNELAKFDIFSKLLGTVTAICSAFLEMGASSIILGAVATSVVKCVLIWIYADKKWKPKFKFSTLEARNAWQYGVYQIGSQLVNQFRGNLDTLLLGFYIDNAQLGAYNLAKQLIQKPATFVLPIVRKISLPLLASAQSNMGKLRVLVKQAHTYVAMLLIFPYVLLCFLDEEIVLFIYGVDKLEVSLFVIPLALFWAFQSIGGALVGSLTQGLGKTNIDFYWNLSVLGLFSLVCIIFAPYGPFTLAWGLAILQAILMNIVFLVFYKRIIQLKYKCYITPILAFTALSILSVYISELLVSSVSLTISYLLYALLVSFLSTGFYYLSCYQFQSDVIELPDPYSFFKF